MDFIKRLDSLLKSTVPAISINTVEEDRIYRDIFNVARSLKDRDGTNSIDKFVKYYRWDRGNGLIDLEKRRVEQPNYNMADPMVLFGDIVQFRKSDTTNPYTRSIILLFDFGAINLDGAPELARQLKNAVEEFTVIKSTLIFVGPRFNWPPEVERYIVHMDYDLPDESQITAQVDKTVKVVLEKYPEEFPKGLFDDEVSKFQSIKASKGLTLTEIKRAIAFSIVSSGKIDPQLITEEKINAIRRGGLLEYIPTNTYSLDKIGGLVNLKEYIKKRRLCFTDDAVKFGLKPPRGILMFGIQGCGKSLASKVIATALGIPMVKFDIGNLMGGIVGESEHRMDSALRMITGLGSCVVQIEELDKALAGCQSSRSDGGVVQRMFGKLLTFMQDKDENKSQSFFVATANNLNELPPEMLRHGRWDQIFFVNLPNTRERKEIWNVHINGVGRKPDNFDIEKLANITEGYTGAEIESIISDAMVEAYNIRTTDKAFDITTELLIESKRKVTPLSLSSKDIIDYMKQEATKRGYMVANSDDNLGDEFKKLVELDTAGTNLSL